MRKHSTEFARLLATHGPRGRLYGHNWAATKSGERANLTFGSPGHPATNVKQIALCAALGTFQLQSCAQARLGRRWTAFPDLRGSVSVWASPKGRLAASSVQWHAGHIQFPQQGRHAKHGAHHTCGKIVQSFSGPQHQASHLCAPARCEAA